MTGARITVGVYALEEVLLPKPAAGKGWAARLAEAAPVLQSGAIPRPLVLDDAPGGLALAEAVDLASGPQPEGTRVSVEPVPGRTGVFVVRLGAKPVGLATSLPWEPGTELVAEGPLAPDMLAAFAAGTLIDTPDGPRAAETLVAGETVTTLANGSRPLRWVGRRQVTAVEMIAWPGLRPVAFAQGVAGNTQPLMVSPRQRMLIDDWRAEVYFGEDRVLVAAQALIDDQAARLVLPPDGVDYVVLLCDRHEVLIAEGALSESFHPGDTGLDGLTPAQRAEVLALVPEQEFKRRRAAFPIVRNAEARALRMTD
jgi:hypothetical protein